MPLETLPRLLVGARRRWSVLVSAERSGFFPHSQRPVHALDAPKQLPLRPLFPGVPTIESAT